MVDDKCLVCFGVGNWGMRVRGASGWCKDFAVYGLSFSTSVSTVACHVTYDFTGLGLELI